jgi:hypothetical protein
VEINVTDYQACCSYYRDNRALADGLLYDLCRCHRGHQDRAATNAKVLLIGRGFASGVERNIDSSGRMGSAVEQLAAHLVNRRGEVDSILDSLARMSEPLDEDRLKDVVAEHGRFCQLLAEITRDQNSVRSFASKYLHFHCPCVPMFDSNAYSRAWKLRPPGRKSWQGLMVFEWSEPADWDYSWFVLCFWRVYQALRERGTEVSVRLVDQYLLWSA